MHSLVKRVRFEHETDLIGSQVYTDQLLSGCQPDNVIAREHFTLILEVDRSCKPDPTGQVGLDGPLALELTNWGRNYIADNNMADLVRYIKLVEAR